MLFSSADFIVRLRQCLALIKGKRPIILNITCGLGQDLMTEGLLALGASPIISKSVDEMREIVSISDALNIKIGALNPNFLEVANVAAITAKQQDKCVVLDPHWAAASNLRTRSAAIFAESTDVLCGHFSDIISIYNESCGGDIIVEADDIHNNHNASILEVGRALSEHNNQVVIIKGAQDTIINELTMKKLAFGNVSIAAHSATGYLVSAIVAAFTSLGSVYKITNFELATLGLSYFNLCLMQAEDNNPNSGPSTFKTALLDSLHSPDWNLIEKYVNEKWC